MKSTNRLFLATLAVGSLLALSQTLYAQDSNKAPVNPPAGAQPGTPPGAPPGGPRGMRGGPTVDQLAKALDLTDEQKTKVKPILDARDEKMKAMRADTSLAPEDRRTKMRSIFEETQEQMKGVLTPEQFEKYQKMGPRPRRPAPPGGDNNSAKPAPPSNATQQ
jgi:Spy/CpxP family protein refolding chaperone